MKQLETPSTIQAIEALLVDRIGLDSASVSPSLVSRGVRKRMVALGLDSIETYEARLRGSMAELQELVEEVVIPESWFFRDERPFRLLQSFAKRRLVELPLGPPIRILSMPCARGEEPLSIAMALRDAGLDLSRFQIHGVDVAARNLDHARRGFYSSNSFRATDLGFRARYFQARAGGYQIVPAILGAIRYRCASVLDPDLLDDEPPYDVIFCRNLLIYLTREAKVQTLRTIDRLLAEDGILLVGHADHLGGDLLAIPVATPLFVTFGDPACFAFQKAKAQPKTGPGSTYPVRTRCEPPVEDSEFHFETIVSPEPTAAISAATAPLASEVRPLLEQAGELADQGRHDEAIRLIDKQIRTKGPNAAAFYLLGVVSQATGDRDGAERCFNKAVYLDPGHDEALLALALLADRRGDSSAASTYRRRADRARAAKGLN